MDLGTAAVSPSGLQFFGTHLPLAHATPSGGSSCSCCGVPSACGYCWVGWSHPPQFLARAARSYKLWIAHYLDVPPKGVRRLAVTSGLIATLAAIQHDFSVKFSDQGEGIVPGSTTSMLGVPGGIWNIEDCIVIHPPCLPSLIHETGNEAWVLGRQVGSETKGKTGGVAPNTPYSFRTYPLNVAPDAFSTYGRTALEVLHFDKVFDGEVSCHPLQRGGDATSICAVSDRAQRVAFSEGDRIREGGSVSRAWGRGGEWLWR